MKSPVAKADETEIARLNEEVTKQVSRAKADETEIARLNEEVTKQVSVPSHYKSDFCCFFSYISSGKYFNPF